MARPMSKNITRHESGVTRAHREALNGHRGVTVWFTGLSASGKSTIAVLVERTLTTQGIRCFVLDGDNVRLGLNRDLGFSPEDRNENIRRIGEVAKLFTHAGVVNLVAFISPYQRDRNGCRELQQPGDFVEIFVDSPLEVCERRDPRGLYRKARAGEIPEFTGISAPYEPPLEPELVLNTDQEVPERSAARVVLFLENRGYLDLRS